MNRKYAALRLFAVINKIVGVVMILIGGGIIMLALSFAGSVHDTHQEVEVLAILIAWLPLVIGAGFMLSGVQMVATGDLFNVFMDIEANTRSIPVVKPHVAQKAEHPERTEPEGSEPVVPSFGIAPTPIA